MAAAVLNTAQAVETSVFVVRAFVQLRRLASGNGELSVKLTDLSATLELALVEQLRRSRAERWLAENKDGIAAYNALVDPHGAFADTVRTF